MSSQARHLNAFLLTMICIATVLTIRTWPMNAEYGLGSLAFLLVAALMFLIPTALISAELATGWPQRGGIYAWVKEAFGERVGFAAAWFVWISNVVWYPTILSFVAVSLAYSIAPQLSQNALFLFTLIFSSFWIMILMNMKGMKLSGWMSSLCLLCGTMIPAGLIIGLGISWIAKGLPVEIPLSLKGFIPKISSIGDLVFFAGLLVGFSGMEMPAVHVNDVKSPKTTYPKAIFIASSVIIVLSLFGTLAVSVVIPKEKINLATASLETLCILLKGFHLDALAPFVSFLVAIGALGAVSTWIPGPSRSLLVAVEASALPKTFYQVNQHDMPTSIFLIQGIIVSILSFAFLVMPSIESAFWMLTVWAAQLYLIAYSLLFLTGIILRYKHKDVVRTYRISQGNLGMWIVSSVGLVSALFAIMIGFIPPKQLDVGQPLMYVSLIILGMFLFALPPFLIKQKAKTFRTSQVG